MARTSVDLISEGRPLESVDPATGDVIGSVPVTPPGGVEAVAAEVARVQAGWALVPVRERVAVMARAADLVLDRADELSLLFTREAGKPISESSIVEIGAAALQLSWVARWADRYLAPERIPDPQVIIKHKRHWIRHVPLGVVGIIGPWNYPFMLPFGQIAFALAAGNGVVLKPSELTPLSAEAIGEVLADAGLPSGLLRIAHGGGETGAAVCAAPSIAKIFFTGSVETGKLVRVEAARGGKEAQLELGGNDAAIVCADADLDRAAAGILWGGVTNAGQTCAAVERVYVDRRVHDELVRRLVERAGEVRAGDPRDPATQLGPLNNEAQYEKVLAHLEDARAKGASVACGGPVDVPGLPGRFIEPVVLVGATPGMDVMREETFGPVIPIAAFDTEDEAVREANGTDYGLGASVWSRDRERARAIAERLEAGMVWINDHAYSHGLPQTPWGGIKDSGAGVSHSRFGFYEMTEQRLLGEDSGRLPTGWWYPYDEARRRGFLAVVASLTRSRPAARARSLWDRRGELGSYARSLLR